MSTEKPEPYLGYYPNAELVFGLVFPLGTDSRPVLNSLRDYLDQFAYEFREVKISDLFEKLLGELKVEDLPRVNTSQGTMRWKIAAGNRIRLETEKEDVLGLAAAAEIAAGRDVGNPQPLPRKAHVLVSLKRPEEVECLRRIYGRGFFLIGVSSTRDQRKLFLTGKRGVKGPEAEELMRTDENEDEDYGQRTRDAFFLSDVFVSLDAQNDQIPRFLDLIFSNPFVTPNDDERAMYMAYAAALSSGDLSRQVGAAIFDSYGDILAIGCNDVPKFGGGLYGPAGKHRDMDLGHDSNDVEKIGMAKKIMDALMPGQMPDATHKAIKDKFSGSGFFDITEFGRAVHAEMEALLACARTGRSPRGGVIYATTFPCHNCTRHIVDAGLAKVLYIEPYPKSKAFELHEDSITSDLNEKGKVPFLPFIGVGPRRYLDLFSLALGTGFRLERKKDAIKTLWSRKEGVPRLQMPPTSFLQREEFAIKSLKDVLSTKVS